MARHMARGYLVLAVTLTLLGLIIAACVPGINTHQDVQAFIERIDETRVLGTLVLPEDARLVRFEFVNENGSKAIDNKELVAGTHEYRWATTSQSTSCWASGFLGEKYFLLPCRPR